MGIPAWHVTLCLCAAREFHTSQSSYTLLKWPPGQERQEEKFRLEPYSLCLHRLALWKGHWASQREESRPLPSFPRAKCHWVRPLCFSQPQFPHLGINRTFSRWRWRIWEALSDV